MLLGEAGQRAVDGEDFVERDGIAVADLTHVVERDVLAAAFVRLLFPGVVHENAAHGPGRSPEEMRAALEPDVLVPDEAEVRLVDEPSRREGVTRTLVEQFPPSHLAELGVDAGEEPVECALLAGRGLAKQDGDGGSGHGGGRRVGADVCDASESSKVEISVERSSGGGHSGLGSPGVFRVTGSRGHPIHRPLAAMTCSPPLVLCALLAFAACDASDPALRPLAVYEAEVATFDGPERFRVAVATDEQAALADAALATGRVGVVHGTLAPGDGDVNADYSWHLVPETITFPDLAIEVCDGRPRSDVEADLDYWLGTVGIYCPWGARLTRRVDGSLGST